VRVRNVTARAEMAVDISSGVGAAGFGVQAEASRASMNEALRSTERGECMVLPGGISDEERIPRKNGEPLAWWAL
jgi:hypothetical protein